VKKKDSRQRRAKSTRARINKLHVPRLTVHRSGQHIYAQIISPDNAHVLVSASTLQGSVSSELSSTKNKSAAALVGRLVAEKAQTVGVQSVAFDRSGFLYHGRIKALADAAREAGLKF